MAHAETIALCAALLLTFPAAADPAARQRTYFTDTRLLRQDGTKARFFTDVLRDQVVVIHFIYTHCGDACPLLTQKLVQAGKELGDTLGHGVRFVSISVDPARDAPADLRAFARKQGAVHPGWTFLTGDAARVQLVTRKLGETVSEPADHTTGFIVGNTRTGHWKRLRPDMPPDIIAEEVKRLVAEKGQPGTSPAQGAN